MGNELTLKRVDVKIDESKLLCIYFDVNLFRLLVDVMLVDVKIELTFSNEQTLTQLPNKGQNKKWGDRSQFIFGQIRPTPLFRFNASRSKCVENVS